MGKLDFWFPSDGKFENHNMKAPEITVFVCRLDVLFP